MFLVDNYKIMCLQTKNEEILHLNEQLTRQTEHAVQIMKTFQALEEM